VAGDATFTWTKQVALSYGGTRNGMVVFWPKAIKAKNEARTQWHHVIDIAPTILEAAGLPELKSVNGTPQIPIEGTSMVHSFGDADPTSYVGTSRLRMISTASRSYRRNHIFSL
jgi:arylsulfatase A-like enzyme